MIKIQESVIDGASGWWIGVGENEDKVYDVKHLDHWNWAAANVETLLPEISSNDRDIMKLWGITDGIFDLTAIKRHYMFYIENEEEQKQMTELLDCLGHDYLKKRSSKILGLIEKKWIRVRYSRATKDINAQVYSTDTEYYDALIYFIEDITEYYDISAVRVEDFNDRDIWKWVPIDEALASSSFRRVGSA